MPRKTRLTEPLRLAIARHMAEGGTIRAAVATLRDRLAPSQVSRWRSLDADFRALLHGADLLNLVRVFGIAAEAGITSWGRGVADGNVDTLIEWARTAIYADDPAARREALDLLKTAIGPRAPVPYLPPGMARLADQILEKAWDGSGE